MAARTGRQLFHDVVPGINLIDAAVQQTALNYGGGYGLEVV